MTSTVATTHAIAQTCATAAVRALVAVASMTTRKVTAVFRSPARGPLALR